MNGVVRDGKAKGRLVQAHEIPAERGAKAALNDSVTRGEPGAQAQYV